MTRPARDEGTGEPAVVLLHAFPLNSAMWDGQIEALSKRWRVVAPDLIGAGAAEAPEDPGAYSMDAYADAVAEAMDERGIERAVVGGLSIGGYVTFAFLRRHRERVLGVVLADTRPGTDSPEVVERRLSQQRELRENGIAAVVEASLDTLLSDDTKQNRPEVVARARRIMEQNPAAGMIGAHDAMLRRPDSTAELEAIDVPTLVIVGADDKPSPPEIAAQMAERIPDVRLEVIPRAGHLTALEAPDDFNRALGSLLERVGR